MKFIVYADLQATDGEDRSFQVPGKSLQETRVERFFARLRELFEEHACDGLIDLGDTTDDRSAIPVPVIDTLMRGLEPFKGKANFKIVGNHEQFVRDATVDVGRLFDGVFHVGRREIIERGDGSLFFLASYPGTHEDLTHWLDTQSLKHRHKRKILFGHFQLVGATLGPSGTEAVLGVPKNIVERFDLVLLGHIHLPQSFGKRIHYVGSPFEQNWGEQGQSKRVGLLDTKTLTVRWLPMTGFPVHHRGSLDDFMAEFDPASEDRWKVELKNHAEAERFYKLPHSAQFEALYAYDQEAPSQEEAPQDWSLDASLKRWVEVVPPRNHGIEIAPAEVVDVGRQLAG